MQDNHTYPVPAPSSTRTRLSRRHRPGLRLSVEELFPRVAIPFPPLGRRRTWAAVGVGAALTAALLLLLWQVGGNRTTPDGSGAPLPGGLDITDTQAPESDTDPAEPEVTPADTEDLSQPAESEAPDEEPGESAAGDVETDGEPLETAETEAITDPLPEETVPTEEDPGDGDPDPGETDPAIPEGCLEVAYGDVSLSALGVGYLQSDGMSLPSVSPADSPWKGESPAVLIVNTRPYEGYGGDAAWYDPAAGGLALTDSPNAPDGVVALGGALAVALREQGITVIHLRVPVSAEDSTATVTARTEEAIRYYCRLYPEISLVLDLRRSAELTADGRILATQGQYDGTICAQLRISVSGGRDGDAAAYDLAVAQSIREEMWSAEPTLTRPVRVKSGAGIAGDLTDLRILTLELGSAGNTYAEAEALVEPLGDALTAVLKKYS